MCIIHLVSSLSTAGSLKWNISHGLLQGEVCCTMDDPAIGPLQDGKERMLFWQNPDQAELTNDTINNDIYEPWRALQQQITRHTVSRIILWIGETASDYVFERMAAYWLISSEVPLLKVCVPPVNGQYATAASNPKTLAGLFPFAQLITNEQRQGLSTAFEKIKSNPGMLRELDTNGQLQFLDLSAYDDLILSGISVKWQRASSVIGKVMENADPRNPPGDGFLASRLHYLIRQNIIESDSRQSPLRSFKVRRK